MTISRTLATLAGGLLAGAAGAQTAPAAGLDPNATPVAHAAPALERVTVEGHYDNAVGTSDAASQGVIRRDLLKSRPALRTGELLEYVPGLIVTQHSGDGKANQYFLRGYNLDHGTDFATSVDGMPVNMPSHGHGQGYTDLNFVIPELVDRIEYRKGPYFAADGDFAAAGAADLRYLRRVERPFGAVTIGEHGYRRGVLAGSTAAGEDRTLLAALELAHNHGPWTLPEDLHKANGLLSLAGGTAARGWSAALMGYDARWDATDQVPQRAIDSGAIDRFDAIDDSDSGETSRYSASGEWHGRGDGRGLRASAYLMRYRLKLFSDFTYALERPAQGDQFEQSDERTVLGLRLAHDREHTLAGRPSQTEFGLQLRHDRIEVGLFDTVARRRTATTRDDDVRETGLGLYVQNSTAWNDWFRSVLGLRADHYHFRVRSPPSGVRSTRASERVNVEVSSARNMGRLTTPARPTLPAESPTSGRRSGTAARAPRPCPACPASARRPWTGRRRARR